MTPKEQNKVIAEYCGWKLVTDDPDYHPYYISPKNDMLAVDAAYAWMPKYCSDLNAMHEAEMFLFESYDTLEGSETLSLYTKFLCGLKHPLFATAAQRAEAFLRTFNLWK